ncbi:MAG: hypothetical protein ACK4WM_10895 [Thermoflexales bacterium]
MKGQYIALRVLGTLLKVLGVIGLLLTVVFTLGTCLSGSLIGSLFRELTPNSSSDPAVESALGILGVLAAFPTLLAGLLVSLALFAQGELLFVYIALEENTRKAVALLESLQQASKESRALSPS